MSLIINSNMASLNAQRQLSRSGTELDKATTRLSSGKRVNSAADDAAGLAISNRMISQVRGLEQAIRNTNDGISLLQVADGALSETSNMLQRIRELSVQAANGIYSDGDRVTLNAEVKQLLSQIDFVAKNTQFNGVGLLDGSQKNIELQVGSEAAQTVSFKISAVSTKELGLGSQSADLIGAEMEIDSNGTLKNAVSAGAIKINGKNIPNLADTATVQDLVDAINTNIPNVQASATLVLKAVGMGNGVLSGSNTLTLTAVGLDGGSTNFVISNTTNMQQLVDKINEKTGGIINASVDDAGHLIIASDRLSTLTAVDGTAGTATGISPGASPSTDITNILTGLNNYWISEAENLISTHFGLVGDGRDLILHIATDDGPGNSLAFVNPNPADFSLNLDSDDFTGVSLPNGPVVGGWMYGDRIIAHEMVHAVMATNMNLGILDGWFTEGVAELIHGADERVLADSSSAAMDTEAEFQAAWAGAQAPGSPGALGYSAGYVAAKILHQSILQAGGTGIKEVMARLALGQTLDQSLQFVASAHSMTAWTDQTSFESLVNGSGWEFITGAADATLDAAVGASVRMDFAGGANQTDTGSIAGSDYGGAAKTKTSVLPNSASQGPINFNLVVPAQYSGGNQSVDARLMLTSTSGEAIVVAKGKDGVDADLSGLGLQEIAKDSLTGKAVSVTNQALSIGAKELVINDVDIGAVDGALGISGKVAAINKQSDTTGVIATTVAAASFSHSAATRTEWVSANSSASITTEVIGLRGAGIPITTGDSMQVVAQKINQYSVFHGAAAYVDNTGKLHIYSDLPLNPQQSTSYFTNIGLTSNSTAVGSLNIRGTEVALSNINSLSAVISDLNSAQAVTGVHADVDENGELKLSAANAFSITFGATNGLKTMAALGMKVSTGTTGGDLSDTDGDYSLTDESIKVDARISLQSRDHNTIRVALNSTNAASSTGLLEFNATASSINGSSLSSLNIGTLSSAKKAIAVVDNALNTINDTRSRLGAVNNRLDFTVANLSNVIEKTTSALSRIVDADFADETAKLSRSQVLQLAAQSMLAQANSRPQQVLSLLR